MSHSAAFKFFFVCSVTVQAPSIVSLVFGLLGLLVPVAGCWSICLRGMFFLLVIVSGVSAPVPFILDVSI